MTCPLFGFDHEISWFRALWSLLDPAVSERQSNGGLSVGPPEARRPRGFCNTALGFYPFSLFFGAIWGYTYMTSLSSDDGVPRVGQNVQCNGTDRLHDWDSD